VGQLSLYLLFDAYAQAWPDAERGYTAADLKKMFGENFLRVYAWVWKAPGPAADDGGGEPEYDLSCQGEH